MSGDHVLNSLLMECETLLLLLMIILEWFGFTFWKRKVMSCLFSNLLKKLFWLNLEKESKSFVLTMELSSLPRTLKNTSPVLELFMNTPVPTHPNKMGLLNERTETFWKSLEVCFLKWMFLNVFGAKLSWQQLTWLTGWIRFTWLWKSFLADYDHLRVFGCLCFVHLHCHMRNKLDSNASACVFLGYPAGHKGF